MATFDKITIVYDCTSIEYVGGIVDGKPNGKGCVVGFKKGAIEVKKLVGVFAVNDDKHTVTGAEFRFIRDGKTYLFTGTVRGYTYLVEGKLINETDKYTLEGTFDCSTFKKGVYTRSGGKLTGNVFNFEYYDPPHNVRDFAGFAEHLANADGSCTYEPSDDDDILAAGKKSDPRGVTFEIATFYIKKGEKAPVPTRHIYKSGNLTIESPANSSYQCHGEGTIYTESGDKLNAKFDDGELVCLSGNSPFVFTRHTARTSCDDSDDDEDVEVFTLEINGSKIKLNANNY